MPHSLVREDTHFVNPHGLDDDAHYTTARELALITRAALENPDFGRSYQRRKQSSPCAAVRASACC